jgi:hypothetical protein
MPISNPLHRKAQLPTLSLAFFCAFMIAPTPLWALGEIQASPALAAQAASPDTNDGQPEQAEPDDEQVPDAVRPQVDPNAPLPEVSYDLGKLPAAVREMHDKIVEACKTGDIEKLRPLIGTGSGQTQLSLTEIEGDPIKFLHDLSGDTDGQEILAILEMLLETGYVHINVGKPDEAYVWPYFYAMPLSRLDARQRVELFKIVTAGDYEDMKTFDAYVFYRIGITPQGRWAFFVAGD